ncbi:MAG: hypothetical protein OEL84_08090 [Nitrosopumilus sp.]|nr:hypothetical protein [Nitrosopumilus sp.]
MLSKITKRREEIESYFSNSKNSHERAIHQFFKKEINPQDIRIEHTDVSIIGNTVEKRKYACALWKMPSYHKIIPWLRIGIPYDEVSPSLEVVLPVFHGDMPKLWSKGRSYFRLGIEYTIGKHGPILQFFTNPVDLQNVSEILDVIKVFHRKIKSYDTIK